MINTEIEQKATRKIQALDYIDTLAHVGYNTRNADSTTTIAVYNVYPKTNIEVTEARKQLVQEDISTELYQIEVIEGTLDRKSFHIKITY